MRHCLVCTNTRRMDIEAALLSVPRPSDSEVGRLFGVSSDSVGRHRRAHLPGVLAKANAERSASHGSDLLGQLDLIVAKAQEYLKEGDSKAASGLLREWRESVKLKAQAEGTLGPDNAVTVQVALVSHPEWTLMLSRILAWADQHLDMEHRASLALVVSGTHER